MKQSIKNKRGFTLLEMIMVMLFIAIAFSAILYVFTTSMTVSTEVEGEIVAMNLANEKIEDLLRLPFTAMTIEAKTAVPNFSNYYRQVDIATVEADLKSIDVTVYWQVQADEVSYTLTTLRSNTQ